MSVFTGVVDQLKKIKEKQKKLSSIQFWGKDMISEFEHLGAILLVCFFVVATFTIPKDSKESLSITKKGS